MLLFKPFLTMLQLQFAYLLVEKLNHNNSGTSDSEVLVLLSLLTMILHKSVENVGFLSQATEAILSNEQLQNTVTSLLAKAKMKVLSSPSWT